MSAPLVAEAAPDQPDGVPQTSGMACHRSAAQRLLRGREVVLVAVTIAWGVSFLVVKHGLAYAEPMGFVAIRFLLAALVMAALTGRTLGGMTPTELRGGILIGAALAAGNGLQAVGLLTIASSTSAFLTALSVPLVPVLAWMFTRRAPSPTVWLAVALAFCGVAAMSGVTLTAIGLGTGEVLTLLCALAIGAEILLLGRYAPHVKIRRLTVVQLATCGLLGAVAAPLLGESVPDPSWGLLATTGVLAISSALVQLAMSWAQSTISASRATVIYAGEPVWAGLAGALAGEQFTSGFAIGAPLVFLALLIPALDRRRPAQPTTPFGPPTQAPPTPSTNVRIPE